MKAKPPPSREAWLVDAELRGGHTRAEAIQYLSDCADWEDRFLRRRAVRPGAVPADAEPRAWWRWPRR